MEEKENGGLNQEVTAQTASLSTKNKKSIKIGIIAAIFVALFAIRVRVDLEMSDELHLSVLAFGIRIKILPKKPKKYKLSNYTPKKIAKRDRIAAEKAAKKAEAAKQKKAAKEQKKKDKEDREAKLTKADKKAIKAKKKASRPPIPDMISLFSRILKIFFSGLFSKFHFHVARIKIDIGSDNAATTAMMCVGIRTAIRPVLNFLAKHSNLHGMRSAEISVTPNYLSEEIKADVKLGFSTSLGGILGVAIRAGFSFIFGWFKIDCIESCHIFKVRNVVFIPQVITVTKLSFFIVICTSAIIIEFFSTRSFWFNI